MRPRKPQPSAPNGQRLLIVSAPRPAGSLAVSALAGSGYEVVRAHSVAEARRTMESRPPDAVLIEHEPAVALEVMRELAPADEGLPLDRAFGVIVLLTGDRPRADEAARAIAAGADACLSAPADPARLRELLDAIVSRRTAIRDLAQECRRLRERDVAYRVLAAIVGEMVYDWNLTNDSVEWNVALIRKLRYPPEHVKPTSQWWLDHVHPDDRGRVARAVHQAFEERATSFEFEYRFAYADHGYATVVDSATVMYDEQQRPVRVVGIMKDVTERRQLEEQLRTAQKMEAIGRLAGGIAHDFNNMLTAILGFSLMLKDALESQPDLADQAAEIEAVATSAANLTRQLLAFSRRQIVRPEVLSLNEVVTSNRRLIERLIGEHIHVESALSDAEPAVMADRSQLEQILLNLAVNARDAMTGGGTLRLSTGVVQIDEAEGGRRGWTAGSYAHLAVSDTGVGMDEDTRTRVFEPFFTTKPPGHGTGLGLSTVYGSVSQSGGYVTVTSTPGHGATFDVYLPSVPDAPRRQGDSRDADGLAARTGETILVVEDEPSVRGLVERVLTGAGYHVVTATDGIEALETAAAHGGDLHLLLTDVVLPGVSGMTVAARLRAGSPALKVLYMSGYSEEVHGPAARGASDRQLLQKPFSPGRLLQGVRRALDDPAE